MVNPLFSLSNMKEAHYQNLAKILIGQMNKGNCIALHGDLGMGKSCFARSFIRTYLQNPKADVPSPTYNLAQNYICSKSPQGDLWHYDFYRIENEDEIVELGFDDNLDNNISLVEWPEKIKNHLPENTLFILFKPASKANERTLSFIGNSNWDGLISTITKDKTLSTQLTKNA